MDDAEVISFLLQTEIIPLCLRIMDNGSELSQTVATFIIQKILLDDMGLKYDHNHVLFFFFLTTNNFSSRQLHLCNLRALFHRQYCAQVLL